MRKKNKKRKIQNKVPKIIVVILRFINDWGSVTVGGTESLSYTFYIINQKQSYKLASPR